MFHYPSLEKAYTDIEHTFLVADAVKVSPILQPLKAGETYSAFFPPGDWVDMDTFEVLSVVAPEGEMRTLTPAINVKKHLRPGYIVPVQYGVQGASSAYANSTEQLARTNINMLINRDHDGFAQGRLFLDEGKNISEIEAGTYEYYEFKMVDRSIQKLTLNTDNVATGMQGIASFIITNAEDLKDTEKACYISSSGRKVVDMAEPRYDATAKTLTLKAKDGTIDAFQMQSVQFSGPNDRYSLCDVYSAGWHVDNDTYHEEGLQNNSFSFDLVSDKIKDKKMYVLLYMGNSPYDVPEPVGTPMIRVFVGLESGKDRFQVPWEIVDPATSIGACNGDDCKLAEYVKVDTSSNPTNLITVMSKAAGKEAVDVWSLNAVVQEAFLNMMSTTVHSKAGDGFHGIMGLAERTSNELFIADGVYSLWSRDDANPVETGSLPASNAYGVHPFYLSAATDSTWFGVYTNLAAAQDWWVQNDNATGTVQLTTIATGGLADVVIMFGSTPNDVTKRYHDLVGKPVLTPMWALGWHQCRWGYKGTDDLAAVVKGYEDNNLPLDAQWVDIDYMYDYRDFTYNKDDFAGLPEFVDGLHDKNMHFVPILDAGIAQRKDGDYEAYNSGVQQDVFIKAYEGGPDFTGEVWPVDAVYPDFTKSATKQWWKANLDDFHNTIKFDGLWLDMNEASNFCNGVCYRDQLPTTLLKHKLPYTPTGRDLETKSIALDAVHGNMTVAGAELNVTQLDAHSLFGTMEVKATHDWFQDKGKRTLIIERSAFAGMGKWGSRWLGDNFSRYAYMGYSVTGVMMHNIMGIPLAGSDICGFLEDTTAELCTRWYQVGAFYPFSRNHNGLGLKVQEPYVFNTTSEQYPSHRYTDFIRHAQQTKLALVNYYYTEISMLHEEGGAFYRPLFFDFPDDNLAYQNLTHNVMLGRNLKVSHESTETEVVTESWYYFPQGTWCSVVNASAGCVVGPQQALLPSRIYQSFVHIRDGSIVPLQLDVIGEHSTTRMVQELQQNPVDLHIHP